MNENHPAELKIVKTYFWETKEDQEDQGIVDHLIAVFGAEDLGRDICHPGSFKKTLQERADQIVVLDMHRHESTLDAIGIPLKLWEIGRNELPEPVLKMYPEATGGLRALTQFLIDTPEGEGVFKRIKRGAVNSFSFGYDAVDFDYTEQEGKRLRNLRQIRLYEYGPTLFAMMPGARAIGAKAEGGAAGSGEKRVDVGSTTITIRVRMADEFISDSFRVINIGDSDNGIQARIGKLKGETDTTIQAYIFDKEQWTKEEAEEWIKDHKSAFTVCIPKHFNVREAPSKQFLIVEQNTTGKLYKAAVDDEEGTLVLASQDLWTPGTYKFIDQPDTDAGGSEGEKMQMVDLELEILGLDLDLDS